MTQARNPERHSEELSKEELERRKLQRELRELDLPWWMKPGYVGSLLPGLLGLAALFIGFWTGLFDVKRERLELQTEQLEARERRLQGAVASLERERAALDAQVDSLTTAFHLERDRLDEDLIRLRARLAIEPVRVHLRALRDVGEDDATPYHDSSEWLIQALRRAGSKRALLTRTVGEVLAGDALGVVVRGNVLYVLWKGTGDSSWRSKLFALAGQRVTPVPERFWDIFAYERWEEGEENVAVEACRVGLDNIAHSNYRAYVQGKVLSPCVALRQWSVDAFEAVRDWRLFKTGVEVGVGLALDERAYYMSRYDGLRVLRGLSPRAFLVVAGVILADSTADPDLRSRAVWDFGSTTTPLFEDVPRDRNVGSWGVWLQRHADLVGLLLDESRNAVNTDEQSLRRFFTLR